MCSLCLDIFEERVPLRLENMEDGKAEERETLLPFLVGRSCRLCGEAAVGDMIF